MVKETEKPVLLCIVDGLTWRVVAPAIRTGKLPFLGELAAAGSLQPCVSIFPSITPAATASLVTGCPPSNHGIQGAFWFDAQRGDIEYFGDAPRVIAREGLHDFFDDYLRTLNDDLLRVNTLFELAESHGKSTAGLNLMWRRGKTDHAVDTPLLVKWLPGVELASEIRGPDWLFLGDFVNSQLDGEVLTGAPGGATNRFGFNDEATLVQLDALLKSNASPALTIAYFPDNDFRSHEAGAEGALPGLIDLDRRLFGIAEGQGGVAKWLESTSLIVVGDHGHDDLAASQGERVIDLGEVLGSWCLTPSGSPWRQQDEVLACPNMRAAQISLARDAGIAHREVLDALLADARIDQTISLVENGRLAVQTKDRGRLSFAPASDAATTSDGALIVRDLRGHEWRVDGDLAAVHAEVAGQDRLSYGEYPDALGRLWKGSPGCQESIWVTARPGHEFALNGTTTHQAGSHGSLHRSDSETVLVTAGLPDGVEPSANASITDIAGMCLASLGIERGSPATPIAVPGSPRHKTPTTA